MQRKSWFLTGLLVTCLGAQAAPPAGCPFLNEKIELSEAQQVEIQQLMDAHRAQMQQLHEQMRQQIETVLTPEQQALIEESDWSMGPKGRGPDGEPGARPRGPGMGMFRSGAGCWWMGGEKPAPSDE